MDICGSYKGWISVVIINIKDEYLFIYKNKGRISVVIIKIKDEYLWSL